MALTRYLSALKALDDDNLKQNLIKPSDIDVYWEPSEPLTVEVPKKDNALLKQVRKARQYIWKFSTGATDVYNRSSQKISNAVATLENAYENAMKDPIVLIKPGCIITAVTAGAIFPGRGRKPFLRLFFASAFGVTAAAISYPKTAANVSITYYTKGKELGSSLVSTVKKMYGEKTNVVDKETPELLGKDEVDIQLQISAEKDESATNIVENENVLNIDQAENNEKIPDTLAESESLKSDETRNEEEIKSNVLSSEAELAEKDKPSLKEVEGDFGQSDPEDKDMYSTR